MILKRYTSNWPNYYAAKRFFDEKQKRSRTKVGTLKAVRLPRPVNNTVLYEDGDSMVFRLYDTDIVRYWKTGGCELASGGWFSTTTFDRMYQIAGVSIGSQRGSGNKSIFSSRVRILDEFKKDIPYFDGLKFHEDTGEVLNEELIPSDLSKEQMKPTKAGRDRFKTIWKEIHPRIMLGVNLGVWAEEILERDEQKYSWRTAAIAPAVGRSEQDIFWDSENGAAVSDLELQYLVLSSRRLQRFHSKDVEGISAELRRELPTIRSKLQFKLCESVGEVEDVGGRLLGGTYHTNPKDREKT